LCGYPPVETPSTNEINQHQLADMFHEIARLSKQYDMYIALGTITFEEDIAFNSVQLLSPENQQQKPYHIQYSPDMELPNTANTDRQPDHTERIEQVETDIGEIQQLINTLKRQEQIDIANKKEEDLLQKLAEEERQTLRDQALEAGIRAQSSMPTRKKRNISLNDSLTSEAEPQSLNNYFIDTSPNYTQIFPEQDVSVQNLTINLPDTENSEPLVTVLSTGDETTTHTTIPFTTPTTTPLPTTQFPTSVQTEIAAMLQHDLLQEYTEWKALQYTIHTTEISSQTPIMYVDYISTTLRGARTIPCARSIEKFREATILLANNWTALHSNTTHLRQSLNRGLNKIQANRCPEDVLRRAIELKEKIYRIAHYFENNHRSKRSTSDTRDLIKTLLHEWEIEPLFYSDLPTTSQIN